MRDRPSYTAELVAFARAAETRRAPQRRVLDDPLAKGFLSAHLRGTFGVWARTGRLGQRLEDLFPGLISYVAARHRFIDDVVLKSGAEAVEQVVLLGAGYDSRPWRFQEKLGSAIGFEIDHPATAARKSRVLGREGLADPAPGWSRHTADFSVETLDEILDRVGVTAGLRTAWVWEGVTMYLPRDVVSATLRTLARRSAPGSRLALDFWFWDLRPGLRGGLRRAFPRILGAVGEPVLFGLHPEDAAGFLAREGWVLDELADREVLEAMIPERRRVWPTMYVASAVRA